MEESELAKEWPLLLRLRARMAWVMGDEVMNAAYLLPGLFFTDLPAPPPHDMHATENISHCSGDDY